MINAAVAAEDSFCLPENLTMANVAEIKRGFLGTSPTGRTSIDASGVEMIDLVGIQLLIAMLGQETDGGLPRLSSPSASVTQAFQRAGVPLPETPNQ